LRERLRKFVFREGDHRVSKAQLHRSGAGLATCATHKVDFEAWCKAFGMPDTFFSWFLVTELHVWLLSSRVQVGSGPDGQVLRNFIVECLWEDLEKRAKLIGGLTGSKRRNQIWDLAEEFQTALVVYDVGALGDDMALANSVWKRFFLGDEDVDPQRVETLVKYIRLTMSNLDRINTDDLFKGDVDQPALTWLPIDKMAKE